MKIHKEELNCMQHLWPITMGIKYFLMVIVYTGTDYIENMKFKIYFMNLYSVLCTFSAYIFYIYKLKKKELNYIQ